MNFKILTLLTVFALPGMAMEKESLEHRFSEHPLFYYASEGSEEILKQSFLDLGYDSDLLKDREKIQQVLQKTTFKDKFFEEINETLSKKQMSLKNVEKVVHENGETCGFLFITKSSKHQ